MLTTLKDKRDAGFFTSIAGLMASRFQQLSILAD
jgi:hypothetical protein